MLVLQGYMRREAFQSGEADSTSTQNIMIQALILVSNGFILVWPVIQMIDTKTISETLHSILEWVSSLSMERSKPQQTSDSTSGSSQDIETIYRKSSFSNNTIHESFSAYTHLVYSQSSSLPQEEGAGDIKPVHESAPAECAEEAGGIRGLQLELEIIGAEGMNSSSQS